MTRPIRFIVEHYLVVPLAAAVAIVWTNIAGESYFTFAEAASFLVNDVGMAFALAFLAQEVLEAMLPGGTLHPGRRALLPIAAAAGGIIGATAVFMAMVAISDQPVLAVGWPIACAVDIALTYVVARSIFGRHAAVTFLLLLAIASNTIGLILVSRWFPVAEAHPAALALLILAVGGAFLLRRANVRSFWPVLLSCGTLSWLAFFWSGVHPALALLPIVPFFPHSPRHLDFASDSPRGRHGSAAHFEYVFLIPVQVVLFLFGLVNGGVLMRGFGGGTWAVLLAGMLGRPAGIMAGTGLGVAAGLRLPPRVGWRETVVVALTASTSFTFGLFFASAIFPVGSFLIQTKMGAMATLAATLIAWAAARGFGAGRFERSTHRKTTRSIHGQENA